MSPLQRLRAIIIEEGWAIGVVDHPLPALLDLPAPLPVRWLLPPDRHHYWADPFGVPGDDTRFYCEEFSQDEALGRIVQVSLGQPPIITPCPVPLPGHLSYPLLFQDQGSLYCLPESAQSGRTILFRLDDGAWLPVAEPLPGIAAADATLFRWQDLYWIAYSDMAEGPFDTLCLAWAKQLTGPWRIHPANPVKRHMASSRPGGTPFVHDGQLFRPAQDCRHTYGGAVTINRVTRLDTLGFEEVPFRRIAPPPGPFPHGLHTLSAWGGRTLVDGKRHGPNPIALRRKLRRRLGVLSRSAP